jgi:hypothetical protein
VVASQPAGADTMLDSPVHLKAGDVLSIREA